MDLLHRWQRSRALRRGEQVIPAVRRWLAAPWPSAGQPWREAVYTVLDLETTGLDPRSDAIIEIGLVDVVGGRIAVASAWQTLVAPPAEVSLRPESIRVHGLMPDRLAGAPALAEVLPQLLERIAGHVLVLHVGDFDRPFLERALRRTYGCGLHAPVLDTARLAAYLEELPQLSRGAAPHVPLRRLCDLAQSEGLPVGRQHDALADALTCAQLMLALAARLESFGRTTLGRLRRAGS